MHKNKRLEDKIKDTNPTLSDRSYEPDTTSWNFRLTVKRFTDPETGAVIMPTWPYLMPQILGSRVLGVYKTQSHEINSDLTLPKSEYAQTQEHEKYHAKGHGEFMTRFLTGDPNVANYN